MGSIIKRLIGPLPSWADSSNLILRYELRDITPPRWGLRYLIQLGATTGMFLFVGYAVETAFFTREPTGYSLKPILRILYTPTLILQLIVVFASYRASTDLLTNSARRRPGDTLRVAKQRGALLI